ncbi:hypothetical protein [Nitratireductor pacificus]|uniref:Uncharacterized protein n=1 Tax=Nitratireductor pacificus pht-3B TaxID=391937 RepID=K2MYN9_9HYPH|nr:hypothetical protein [Nitratireductor pacificus]EKF17083.1 hypothetical protein NA2_19973 [Nitratireductor pacificus pht-3B]
MTDTMLPILRQMHEADGDRALARLLLAVPDAILHKYQGVVLAICQKRRFEAGIAFVEFRLTAMRAVRGADGRLAPGLAGGLCRFQNAMAEFAAGGGA